VEEALNAANASDFKPLHDILGAFKEPYKDQEFLEPYQTPPESSGSVYQTFCGT
jgi:uncharacterized protein YdiU (UPF0061 family)